VPVGILGLSFGGQCAVRAAHEATLAGRPEVLRGGVMTLSAPLQIQEAICALDDHTRLPAAHGFRQKLIGRESFGVLQRHLELRLREQKLARPAEDFEGYIREIVLPAYPELPNLVGALLGAARCTQASVLGAVKVPVAVVHAADDFLVPVLHLREAKRAAGENPHVTTRELPGGGHVSFGIADPAGALGMLAAWFGTLR
jgi:alpha-beta hydrolase superfamily lysophospholipase